MKSINRLAVLLVSSLACTPPPVVASAQEGEGEGEGESEATPGPEAGVFVCPPPPALVDDGSLDGTPFVNTTVTIPDELVLCNTWIEAGTPADEMNRKVRVRIPPRPRTSLRRSHMAGFELDGVFVERSPLRAGRHAVSSCAGNAAVTQWEITDSATPILTASVEHALPDVGVITEHYVVAENTEAVVLGREPGAAYFSYTTPEGVSATLAPCDLIDPMGGDSYDALEVIVGFDENDAARVVLRSYATQDTFAGSDPVVFSAAAVTSGSSFVTATGYFAHTYVAQHHNRLDESVIALDRDLSLWHTRFRPGLLQEGNAPRRVAFLGIDRDTLGNGFTVTDTDLASGDDTVTHYALRQGIRRVDSTSLARDATAQGLACPAGAPVVVRGAGVPGFGTTFQLITCDRAAAPGFGVLAVVPVSTWQVAAIGTWLPITEETEFSSSGPTGEVDNAPAFTFMLDGTQHTLAFPAPTYLLLDGGATHELLPLRNVDRIAILDGGGLQQHPDSSDELTRYRSEDGAISFEISRRYVGQAEGHSAIYAPVFAALTLDGTHYVAEAFDALTYTNTHHNWADELVALSNDVTFTWRVVPECGDTYLCYFVSAQRGALELLPPTPVVLLSP